MLQDLQYYQDKYSVSARSEVPDIKVRGDDHAVRRIITNLVSNAIKFTEKGKEVIVAVALAQKEFSRIEKEHAVNKTVQNGSERAKVRAYVDSTPYNDEAIIAVIDQGRGIPLKYQDVIFELFQQVEGSDRFLKGGTGLGLSIAKCLIEQQGDEIWFASESGKGTTFFFPLPLLS